MFVRIAAVCFKVFVPGGEDFVHGGAATPALHAEPLPGLRRSRLSLKDLKGNTSLLFVSVVQQDIVSPGLES